MYDQHSDKNAPDVLGLVKNNSKNIVFSEFVDGTWEHIPNMPFNEVKAPKKSQFMIGLRETQFDPEHYYCFVNTELHQNYLAYLSN